MIDSSTNEPLHITAGKTGGGFILVPVTQLDEVCRLLDEHAIYYWVEEAFISLDGDPETAVVNLGGSGDAQAVQAILDHAC